MDSILLGSVMILAGGVCLMVYILPALIAFSRGHEYRWPLFAIALLAGWSFVGWLIALVWALMPKGKLS